MKKDKPFDISVIIPIYNAEKYLQECLDSVIGQNFSNFEVLLINDGSSDNSGNICNEYAEKYNYIKVFHKENGGVSSARNTGLNVVQGKWITFVDADDYLLPDAFATLHNTAINSDSDLILANTLRLKEGKLSPLHKMKEETTSNVVLSLKQFSLWGYLFCAEIIKNADVRFVDGLAYSEDRVFIYQVALQCKAITYCNTPAYVYRLHADSVCHNPNTVRKAYHHFWAAAEIAMLARKYKAKKEVHTKLLKEEKNVIGMGIEFFTRLPFTKTDYNKVKQDYLKFNCGNWKDKIKFNFIFVKKYLQTKRRKIIKFK